jgi:hypothetical protein
MFTEYNEMFTVEFNTVICPDELEPLTVITEDVVN